MTHVELKELISCLKENGVESFKLSTLEIKFALHHAPKQESKLAQFIGDGTPLTVPMPSGSTNSTEGPASTTNTQPEDETMNFDKILHWSSSQDPSEVPLPLTGEGTT